MAIISGGFSYSAFRLVLPSCSAPSSRLSVSKTRSSGLSASMDSGDELRARLMEFPYVSGPHRDLMVELLSSVETRLGSSLQPCTLPPDVRYFGNPAGTAYASIHLRPGLPSSQDLILHPDHLKTYYEDTQLDRYRQRLHTLPEVSPYISPSLYVRAAVSPTAILVSIDVGAGETTNIEKIIRDHVSPVAKELLQFWMESCACTEKRVGEAERAYLAERDRIIKNKTIELDLGSSFPRLFGQDVADRVLTVLQEHYNK
ncbi:UNVERIFIED_CONTAM: Red chlorophyll catabolite reductase, chloroplastic [Sesamum radiatum]|uniref:Red chlorophyll catabolite reductase, chloroplastic n=1 Tax=Sesamum radiatum TaxID=300843 RepID=A0AAW2RBR3_SESRA